MKGVVVIRRGGGESKARERKPQLPECLSLRPPVAYQTNMASHWEDTSAAAAEEQGEKKTASVSFGFTKTFNKFKVPAADALTSKEDKDFLSVIDKNELHSSKATEKTKELIIPLIQKNRWHRPDRAGQSEESGVKTEETSGVKTEETSGEKDSVESLAVKELIEDSRRQLEQWENGPQTQSDPNLSIPLLMLNKVPEGFEDRDHVAGDLRPESSTEADYASIPVEAYGMALLKGMGWKKEEGIGRTFKQDVKPIETKVRARGLGLGADRAEIKDLEPTRHKRPPKPGEEREKEEELVMGPGGCVLVVSGVHKDLYGKIEGVDPENARAVVKLAIGGKTAAISQHALKVVERKEYDKNSKDLSRFSKAHKEKEKEKERERREEKDKRSSGDDAKHKSAERDGGKGERKRKHRESSPDREKPSSKEARQPPAPRPWLQRDLKVRFIDKSFKGGKYYNSKMCVEDVVTPSTCVCRTEEGRLLDDVKQDMLETIVPKRDDEAIMVVLGEHRGQVGHILQRDKNKCRAIVQLDRNEQVFTLDYDSMCHYVGATD